MTICPCFPKVAVSLSLEKLCWCFCFSSQTYCGVSVGSSGRRRLKVTAVGDTWRSVGDGMVVKETTTGNKHLC